MTREQAIAVLQTIKPTPCRGDGKSTTHALEIIAIDMAIKALEQEPCEDAISRQAVDELSKELVHTTRDKADFLCNFWERLQKLPPVNPTSNISIQITEREKYGRFN